MISKLTKSSRPLSQIDRPLTWDGRCDQVECHLIIPLTNEIQQRLRDLHNLIRILQYARRRGHRPTLTDTVADLRDPSMKRDDFRALARRVLGLLAEPDHRPAKVGRNPGALPAKANLTAPIARPPCRPVPSSPEPTKPRRVPTVPVPSTTQPTAPLAAPLPLPETDLARLWRMMGKAVNGQPARGHGSVTWLSPPARSVLHGRAG